MFKYVCTYVFGYFVNLRYNWAILASDSLANESPLQNFENIFGV